MSAPISDFRGLVAAFAVAGLKVRRTYTGEFRDGFYTPGSTVDKPITASVQRISGKDLERLPSGERTQEALTVYSVEPLYITAAPDGAISDKLLYRGKTYKLLSVNDWSDNGRYYAATAVQEAQS